MLVHLKPIFDCAHRDKLFRIEKEQGLNGNFRQDNDNIQ